MQKEQYGLYRYVSFDTPLVAAQATVARPDPSNLQVAAGAGLIDDQDSVSTFDPQGAVAEAQTSAPAQLVKGSKANPLPWVLPAGTGSASNVGFLYAHKHSAGLGNVQFVQRS